MKSDQNKLLYGSFIFFYTIIAIGIGTLLMNTGIAVIIRNVILSGISCAVVFIAFLQSDLHGDYYFSHQIPCKTFGIVYICCLTLLTVLLALSVRWIPEQSILLFPFLSVAVLLSLLSGFSTGLICYIHFLFLTFLLGDSVIAFTPEAVFLLILSGFIGCILIRSVKKSFLVWRTTCIIIGQYMVIYAAVFILQTDELVTYTIWGGLSCVIQFCILYLTLFMMERYLVHPDLRIYEQLNQAESELLLQLREHDKDAYLNAVHTAYLCEKAALLLEADEQLSKAGGYYHKIGLLRSKNHISKSIEIGMEQHFPARLMSVIEQYSGRQDAPESVEAVIVMMSDLIVTTFTYMYHKNPDQKIDYEKIINELFKKQFDCGILKSSGITIEQLYQLREYYQSEVLYYDFLR